MSLVIETRMAMIYTLVVLFLHMVDTLQQVSLPTAGFKVANLLHLRRHKLNVVPLASPELRDEIKCMTSCVMSDECFSVNTKRKPNGKVLCELLNCTKHLYPERLTRDEGSSHWYPKEPCDPDPCKPNGACKGRSSVLSPVSCVCAEGVGGEQCNIFNKSHNYALLKPTDQSSTRWDAGMGEYLSSKYAVDGMKYDSCTAAGVPGCAHTHYTHDQWWRVDLQVVVPVGRVAITSRKEHHSTLQHFEIKIGNSLANEGRDNAKCGDRHSLVLDETKVISCSPPITGRYVVLQSFYNSAMVLIEVEVYAGQ